MIYMLPAPSTGCPACHLPQLKTIKHLVLWTELEKCAQVYTDKSFGLATKNPAKMAENDLVSGGHGQAGSWCGQWTGWISSAPVQISGCGPSLDGALSRCGQGEGQSFLVSSWAARAVAAAQSFQTWFACVHMYILYANVYICVCVYVCGHDICVYMHVCLYLYIYAFIHVCMCMCMHICA